jgi:hypothetical protein
LAGQTNGRAGLTKLAPLEGLKLHSLECTGTGVTDLGPLRGMPLETLTLSGSGVRDFSPLKGLPLRHLGIAFTDASDLATIAGLPLQSLDIRHTQVRDLAPLQGMKLQSLRCENTQVKDLAPLRGMPLRGLDCRGSPVIDLLPLRDLPDLKKLWCDIKTSSDAAVLLSLKQLETLNERPPAESRAHLERLTQLKFGPWYLIGPFDNPNGKGFDRVYPPEQEIDLNKQYAGKNNETARWHQKPFVDGQINDLRLFREENNIDSVAYVYREIESPEAMDLPIGLGSDDTLTVWLNGKKLLSEGISRPVIPDQNKLTLSLQKGKNQLLMKICQGDGGWAFYFAVK